jgi:ribose/xylose/arabinose/galactoside ABC-type transport system permease subunit
MTHITIPLIGYVINLFVLVFICIGTVNDIFLVYTGGLAIVIALYTWIGFRGIKRWKEQQRLDAFKEHVLQYEYPTVKVEDIPDTNETLH